MRLLDVHRPLRRRRRLTASRAWLGLLLRRCLRGSGARLWRGRPACPPHDLQDVESVTALDDIGHAAVLDVGNGRDEQIRPGVDRARTHIPATVGL